MRPRRSRGREKRHWRGRSPAQPWMSPSQIWRERVPRQSRWRVTVRATSARRPARGGGGRLMPGRPVVPPPGGRSSGSGRARVRWSREKRTPLCRVERSMDLREAGGTATQAALQASSSRGMHTTRRRDSLRMKRWPKRASEPSRTKQGAQNSWIDLTSGGGARRDDFGRCRSADRPARLRDRPSARGPGCDLRAWRSSCRRRPGRGRTRRRR
jgi:hypothetical protein